MNSPKIKAEKMRVLIVDDSEPFTSLICRQLRRSGMTALVASTAEKALRLLAHESFDAILLDDALPGMMGIRAVTEFTARTNAPILFVTGYPSRQIKNNALALGASAFLKKPISIADLDAAIRKLIAGKSRPSSEQ